jgi:DNA mismatch repair protein MutL
MSDSELIATKLGDLNSLGFHVDLFGDNSFIVNAVPYFLKPEKAKDVIKKLFDNISDSNKDIPTIGSFLDDSIKMKACRSAIKSGDSPFEDEVSYLIKQLLKYDNPFACPHGRPTTLSLTKLELEQLFLRKK